MSPKVKFEGLPREMIALRVSREIKEGSYVNLGIGIPTLVSNWIEGMDVMSPGRDRHAQDGGAG